MTSPGGPVPTRDAGPAPTTVPRLVRLGRAICGDLPSALRREWLVTNGLGGYAFGTVAGLATRRYHGPLVAALHPPVDRTVVVGALREVVSVGSASGAPARAVALHGIEHDGGSIEGDGWRWLESVELEGMLPVWTYAIEDLLIEKRVWMPHGRNTTVIRYALVRGDRPVEIDVTPLVTARDHHDLRSGPRRAPAVRLVDDATLEVPLEVARGERPRAEPFVLRIAVEGGSVRPPSSRERRRVGPLEHREEAARGEDHRSTLWVGGHARIRLEPGGHAALVLSVEADRDEPVEASLAAARARQERLVERASAVDDPAPVRQLVLAADQFLLRRSIPRAGGEREEGRTVVAGYPWFNDWGRDTMITLPGLTLETGRADEGRTILRSYARFVRDGLLPNNFPDREDDEPAYHTLDASVWYAVALAAYERSTGDAALVDELLPTIVSIVDRHVAGTRFGIGVDPADGLVRGAAEGYQLTWMDAKVADWVVTPRRGKPVEIQALWVNTLRLAARWLADRGDQERARRFRELADLATASFRARFWHPDLGYLLDVVDGPDGDDPSLRPNQLFALSLPHPLVEPEVARSVLDACGAALLTSGGMRSLAPADPAYRPVFLGDRWTRDAAYHQGTVWSWLIGPYVAGILRFTGDTERAASVLRPFVDHLSDAGLGSISENFEPEPPFEARGCVAQAWGVAEVLRAFRLLAAATAGQGETAERDAAPHPER